MSKMSEQNVEVTTEEVVEVPAVEEVLEDAPKSRRSRKSASDDVAEEAPAVEEAPVVEEVAEEAPAVQAAPVKTQAPEYPAMALSSGAESDAVKAAQKKLGVAESGVVDAATKSAVKACQKKAGLKSDGAISKNTWNAIFA
jgi:murein L,D-transpeptidase YcbB/YkuD